MKESVKRRKRRILASRCRFTNFWFPSPLLGVLLRCVNRPMSSIFMQMSHCQTNSKHHIGPILTTLSHEPHFLTYLWRYSNKTRFVPDSFGRIILYAPSQWETALQWNVVSNWLGACTKISVPVGQILLNYLVHIFTHSDEAHTSC